MVLPESAQVAMGLLQTIGLLVPVLFLSLNHLVHQGDYLANRSTQMRGSSQDEAIEEVDVAPKTIKLAWAALLLLIGAGVTSTWVLIDHMEIFNLVSLALILLSAGLVILGAIFYEIRSSFTIGIM